MSDASDASDAKHHASGARAASRCSCTINPSRYRAVGQWATFSKATHAIDERGPLRSVPSVCSFNFCYTVPRAFGSVQRSTKMNCPAVCRCYYLRERLSTRTSCTPCAKLKERRRKWIRPSESEATTRRTPPRRARQGDPRRRRAAREAIQQAQPKHPACLPRQCELHYQSSFSEFLAQPHRRWLV